MKYLVYPFTMISAYILLWVFQQQGFAPKVASYAIAVIIALLVFIFEIGACFRKKWQPQKQDIVTDALFMVSVQLLLPFLLSFIFLELIQRFQLSLSFWPDQSPIWFQTALMLLVAEFFRYWLHRFAHTWAPLWRFHAIHHAPDKLYWLNVGRFHPLEKALQFLLDTLPFMLLGIGGDLLSAYFVFYAVNGFFQHSNVDLRLGVLNYVISGPELHRWHHSKITEEANSNYGNNLIVWDLLFRTWYLPKDKNVGELGIAEGGLQGRFTELLFAPFLKKG